MGEGVALKEALADIVDGPEQDSLERAKGVSEQVKGGARRRVEVGEAVRRIADESSVSSLFD